MDRESLSLQIENMKFQAKMERWPLSKSIEALISSIRSSCAAANLPPHITLDFSCVINLPLGGIGGAFGAVVAPIVDLFKPTLKEEVVGNMRVYGDAKPAVSSNYVIDYNDKTKTTNKETTLYSPSFNINNQGEASYVNSHRPTNVNHRNETCTDYVGGATSSYGMMDYNSAYIQTNNEKKSATIHNRMNQGGTQMLNQQQLGFIKCIAPDTL